MEQAPIIDIKKYGGQHVAIVDGKIIASGRTLKDVLDQARRLLPATPLQEIKIFSVPLTLTTIYHV